MTALAAPKVPPVVEIPRGKGNGDSNGEEPAKVIPYDRLSELLRQRGVVTDGPAVGEIVDTSSDRQVAGASMGSEVVRFGGIDAEEKDIRRSPRGFDRITDLDVSDISDVEVYQEIGLAAGEIAESLVTHNVRFTGSEVREDEVEMVRISEASGARIFSVQGHEDISPRSRQVDRRLFTNKAQETVRSQDRRTDIVVVVANVPAALVARHPLYDAAETYSDLWDATQKVPVPVLVFSQSEINTYDPDAIAASLLNEIWAAPLGKTADQGLMRVLHGEEIEVQTVTDEQLAQDPSVSQLFDRIEEGFAREPVKEDVVETTEDVIPQPPEEGVKETDPEATAQDVGPPETDPWQNELLKIYGVEVSHARTGDEGIVSRDGVTFFRIGGTEDALGRDSVRLDAQLLRDDMAMGLVRERRGGSQLSLVTVNVPRENLPERLRGEGDPDEPVPIPVGVWGTRPPEDAILPFAEAVLQAYGVDTTVIEPVEEIVEPQPEVTIVEERTDEPAAQVALPSVEEAAAGAEVVQEEPEALPRRPTFPEVYEPPEGELYNTGELMSMARERLPEIIFRVYGEKVLRLVYRSMFSREEYSGRLIAMSGGTFINPETGTILLNPAQVEQNDVLLRTSIDDFLSTVLPDPLAAEAFHLRVSEPGLTDIQDARIRYRSGSRVGEQYENLMQVKDYSGAGPVRRDAAHAPTQMVAVGSVAIEQEQKVEPEVGLVRAESRGRKYRPIAISTLPDVVVATKDMVLESVLSGELNDVLVEFDEQNVNRAQNLFKSADKRYRAAVQEAENVHGGRGTRVGKRVINKANKLSVEDRKEARRILEAVYNEFSRISLLGYYIISVEQSLEDFLLTCDPSGTIPDFVSKRSIEEGEEGIPVSHEGKKEVGVEIDEHGFIDMFTPLVLSPGLVVLGVNSGENRPRISTPSNVSDPGSNRNPLIGPAILILSRDTTVPNTEWEVFATGFGKERPSGKVIDLQIGT